MKIKISTDSTCDLPAELIAAHNIGVLPLYIIRDGEALRDGIDVTPDGMTTVTPLTSPKDAAQADGDNAKTGTSSDGARITSRKTLYERFKTKLKANLDERKQ